MRKPAGGGGSWLGLAVLGLGKTLRSVRRDDAQPPRSKRQDDIIVGMAVSTGRRAGCETPLGDAYSLVVELHNTFGARHVSDVSE